jgi:hypothetical protein
VSATDYSLTCFNASAARVAYLAIGGPDFQRRTVRTKARMIGCPFPHRDEVKRQQLPKEEESRGQMR